MSQHRVLSPHWIQTASGVEFDLLEPRPEDVRIEDVAHALSNICRYTGHVRQFYCPTPDQRVLTADLRWLPAGDLKVGDELLGFDEHPCQPGAAGTLRRRFRPSRVLTATRVRREIVRLEMADGSTVRSSSEHPWLVATKQSRNQKWMTAIDISADVRRGRRRYMHKFFEPWSAATTWTAGWLAGMFDGEGYLSVTNRKGTQLGVSQRQGPLLDEIVAAITSFGCDFSMNPTGTSDVQTVQIRGGWREIARLLGTVNPHRLVAKFVTALNEGLFDKQFNGWAEPMEIIRTYHEGTEWVAGLETSTHTYLCEGYGAHNSVADHSVRVSRVCAPEDALWGLLHDATEAYVNDLAAPFKKMLPDYAAVEESVLTAVAKAFGLELPIPESVKRADRVLLRTEQRDLLPAHDWTKVLDVPPLDEPVVPLPPGRAAAAFLGRYAELTDIEVKPVVPDETPELADRGWSWERRRDIYLQARPVHAWPASSVHLVAATILDIEHWAAANGLDGEVTRAMAAELERRAAKLAASAAGAATTLAPACADGDACTTEVAS